MKILYISSAGGHFAELMKIRNEISKKNNSEIIICTEKNKQTEKNKEINYFLKYGTRSKLVSYFFIFTYNFILAFWILIKEKPTTIITTGAHSSVPFLFFAKFIKAKTIYIESFAKVVSPSLTYKIANKYMDVVFVQHEEMLKVYPNSKYIKGVY